MTKALILAVVAVAVFIGAVAFSGYRSNLRDGVPEQVACTMEAKICPDGSAVGRSGPNCEFAKCPDVVVEASTTPSTEDGAPFSASSTILVE